MGRAASGWLVTAVASAFAALGACAVPPPSASPAATAAPSVALEPSTPARARSGRDPGASYAAGFYFEPTSASAAVGERITVATVDSHSGKPRPKAVWSLTSPSTAKVVGPSVGPSVTVEVTAPGPIRIQAVDGGPPVIAVLAGVAPPGTALAVPALGIEANGRGRAGCEISPGVRVISSEAEWRAFAAGVADVPPPVDLATSSLVVLAASQGAPELPWPVVTRVDPTPPGLVEVVQPHVDYLGGTPQVEVCFAQVLQVAKLPEGAEVRVTCDSLVIFCAPAGER